MALKPYISPVQGPAPAEGIESCARCLIVCRRKHFGIRAVGGERYASVITWSSSVSAVVLAVGKLCDFCSFSFYSISNLVVSLRQLTAEKKDLEKWVLSWRLMLFSFT